MHSDFKTFFYRVILILSFGVLIVGCGAENEPLSKNVNVRLKGEGTQCLNQLGEKISSYLDSQLSFEEVKQVWVCLDGALTDFIQITSPERPEGYPPGALARFFESFFVKREIPLSVAKALMNLKRVFIGGQKEFLTDKEAEVLREFIKKAEGWSVRLNPHLEKILLKRTHFSQSELDEAFDELKRISEELGFWLENQGQVYSQSEALELLNSLRSWLSEKPSVRVLDSVIESLPVFFELKSLLIGGDDLSVAPGEWALFLKKTSAVLSLVQTGTLKVKQGNIVSSVTLDQTFGSVLGDVELLLLAVDTPYSNVESLISKASSLSWWPTSLPANGLSQGLRFFLQKFLLHENMDREFIVDHRVVQSLRQMRQGFYSSLKGENSNFESFLAQMGRVDGNLRIQYVLSSETSKSKRTQLAIVYQLIRKIFSAYETEGFEKEDFARAFAEILKTLKDLGFLDSVDLNYGSRLFLEANVFTLVSNGDRYLSIYEASFYAWMALSAVIESEWVNTDIKNEGLECNEGLCVFNYWSSNYQKYFSNKPYLVTHLNSMTSSQREKFFEIARGASGSHSVMMNSMIFSYLECFMLHFDEDNDSYLPLSEVLKSFEVFGDTLANLLDGLVPKEDTLAFFTYLFKRGKTPFASDPPGEFLRYVHWKLHPERWELHEDRTRLLQILSELGKML